MLKKKTKKVKKQINSKMTLRKYVDSSTRLSNKYRTHRMSFIIWAKKELKKEANILRTKNDWNELFKKYLKSSL